MKKFEIDGTVPDFTELRGKTESDLWRQKVPSFCPRCQEIRGVDEGGSNMASSTQALMWHSFGMCGECYLFNRDYPEQAEKNKKLFLERRAEKERKAVEAVSARRFRVYFLEVNEMLRNTDFINTLSTVKFAKYPDFHKRGLATKAKDLIDEQRAKDLVKLIQDKGIESWYEEETI